MILYNPKEWFGLIFKFHKADTFRKLFWVILSLAIYALCFVYTVKEVLGWDPISTVAIHSLLGFVISLLLVFRTNTAYDRWWEGRKQWGALVNVSRNLAIKINAFLPDHDRPSKILLFDFAENYARILKSHLRRASAQELMDQLPLTLQTDKPGVHHVPNHMASKAQSACLDAYKNMEMSESAYLAMINDISAFTDICGACERIKNSPIPYTYNMFIKKIIFAYIITMPWALTGEFGYWTILITVFVFYTLASLEIIAETIEDPFGTDTDDLPTDQLAETIANNVHQINQIRHF